jgi:glycosyltransferase involved in cell wall biosynthesis
LKIINLLSYSKDLCFSGSPIYMHKSVFIVGPFQFPVGGAASRRVLGVSKSLSHAGYSVTVISGQCTKNRGVSFEYENTNYISVCERFAEKLPKLLKHILYFGMGRKTVQWLNAQPVIPDIIIVYSGYTPYLIKLIPWCNKNNVKLVFDAVEWYKPSTIFGWVSPYQINIELAMRYLIPKVGNVISISSYLHQYFVGKNCNSTIVPPSLNVKILPFNRHPNNTPVKFIYAGTPGTKDLLNTVIEAVLNLYTGGYNIHFTVAGVNKTESLMYKAVQLRSYDEVSKCIDFVGTVSHEKVLSLVADSNYSILIRNYNRVSSAGFPTKFVESFSVGTPVIANLTSDLSKYLIHGETGFVCKDINSSGLESIIINAISASEEQYSKMCCSCRLVAEENFDYRNHTKQLSAFLDSI